MLYIKSNLNLSRIALVLIPIIFVVLLAFLPNFGSQLETAWAMATTHMTETYSQLYFINPKNLPVNVEKPISPQFSFAINNHLGKTHTYQYEVALDYNDQAHVLKTGAVTLENGQTIVMSAQFRLPADDMVGNVVVKLLNSPDYISFGTQT